MTPPDIRDQMTNSAAGVTDRDSFAAAVGADAQTMADMDAYLALLTEWNERMNLVGPSALAAFWGPARL